MHLLGLVLPREMARASSPFRAFRGRRSRAAGRDWAGRSGKAEPRHLREIVVTLAVALAITTAGAVAASDDAAKSAYQAGRALIEKGRLEDALSQLELAVQLDPGSRRYRRGLDDAVDRFLAEATTIAPSLGTSQYSELVKLARTCSRLRPTAPQARVVEARLLAVRGQVVGEIQKARELAASGDGQAAAVLLINAEKARSEFAELAEARADVDLALTIARAKAHLAVGKPLEACSEARSALTQRPTDGRAQALVTEATSRTSTAATNQLAVLRRDDSFHSLAEAVVLAQAVARGCPGTAEGAAPLDQLQAAYEAKFDALLRLYPLAKDSRAAEWAFCGMAAEALPSLPAARAAVIRARCAGSSSLPKPSVGIEVQQALECAGPDLMASVSAGLPAGVVTRPSSASAARQEGVRAVDVLVVIEPSVCQVGEPVDARVERQSSTFIDGYDRVDNPDYYAALERAHSAEREVARLQALQRLYPADVGLPWQVVGAQIGLTAARRALSKEAAFTQTPRLTPYVVERAHVVRKSTATATLVIADPRAPIGVGVPVKFEQVSEATAVRGVHPADQSGLKNIEPTLPADAQVIERLRRGLTDKIVGELRRQLPRYFAARAFRSWSPKDPAEALGNLASLWMFSPFGDQPGLQALVDGLGTRLVEPSRLALAIPALAEFESEFSLEALRAASPSPSRANMLESALAAVVVVRRGDSLGSGFIVSADGYILTNHHVVDDVGPIEVESATGDAFLAKVIQQDETADLALLKISSNGLPFLKLAPLEAARIGEEVFALGSPSGLEGSASRGIVSARRRLESVRVVQVDAAINPGNSGGPIVLSDGRVVAISAFMLRDREGLNFGIAAEEALERFSSYLKR